MSCRTLSRASSHACTVLSEPIHRAAVALAPIPPDGDWVMLLIRFALRATMALFAFGTARRVLGDPRP